MTDQPDQELPSAQRRRLIIRAVLRGLVVTTVLVVLYYMLPMDRPLDTGTVARLLIGLCIPFRIVAMNSAFLRQLKRIGNDKAGWYRGSLTLGMGLLGPLLGNWLSGAASFTWCRCPRARRPISIRRTRFIFTNRSRLQSWTLRKKRMQPSNSWQSHDFPKLPCRSRRRASRSRYGT